MVAPAARLSHVTVRMCPNAKSAYVPVTFNARRAELQTMMGKTGGSASGDISARPYAQNTFAEEHQDRGCDSDKEQVAGGGDKNRFAHEDVARDA